MKKAILVLSTLVILGLLGIGTRSLMNSRTHQFFGGLIYALDTQEKVVALTFDDGPTHLTGEIIDLLERLDVKATFFVVGQDLEKYPEEGKALVAAGHELGNHSYSHQRMVFKSPAFIREELDQTDQLIRNAGHEGEIFFRPPNGKKLLVLPYILNQRQTQTVMWDLEPDSTTSDPKKMVEYVAEKVQPGSIILLHIMYPSRRPSLEAVEGIVQELRGQGYTFVTLSQLVN